MPQSKSIKVTLAIKELTPNFYTSRVHLGTCQLFSTIYHISSVSRLGQGKSSVCSIQEHKWTKKKG